MQRKCFYVLGMLNFLIVFLYRRATAAQIASTGTTRLVDQKVELRLTIYAIVTFAAQFFMALYNVRILLTKSFL